MVCYFRDMLHLWQPPQFWINLTKSANETGGSESYLFEVFTYNSIIMHTLYIYVLLFLTHSSTTGLSTPRNVIAQKRKFESDTTSNKSCTKHLDNSHIISSTKRHHESGASPMHKRQQQRFFCGADDSSGKLLDMNETLGNLNQSIAKQKQETQDYECYLQAVLNNVEFCDESMNAESKHCEISTQASIVKRSLQDTMIELDCSIQTEIQNDAIYEMKLKAMLLDLD